MTIGRIVLAALITLTLFYEVEGGVSVCLALLLLGEITDVIDGYLARRWDVVSTWGALLDPFSDAVSRTVIYIGLAWSGWVWLLVPLSMMARDLTVAYARVIMASVGGSPQARCSGKLKAVVQAFGAGLTLTLVVQDVWLPVVGSCVSITVIVVCFYSLIDYLASTFNLVILSRSEV